ncbi:hypothetical protein MAHJHV28_47000 [Mycobacterium avium subsp. hominissuis]
MQQTAAQAAAVAWAAVSAACAAATAYETAFAAHVPPAVIAENRALLAQLVAITAGGTCAANAVS